MVSVSGRGVVLVSSLRELEKLVQRRSVLERHGMSSSVVRPRPLDPERGGTESELVVQFVDGRRYLPR